MDTKLRWDYHREKVEEAATKRLSALSALASSTWGTGLVDSDTIPSDDRASDAPGFGLARSDGLELALMRQPCLSVYYCSVVGTRQSLEPI